MPMPMPNAALDISTDWDNLTELEQLNTEYSDYYKEAYGVRPRSIDTTTWTVEDFKVEFERLSRICEENRISEAKWEAEAVERFEATITKFIGYGAGDRETAIRWFMDANQTSDPGYLCYELGLPYRYLW